MPIFYFKLNPGGNMKEIQNFWTFSWHEIGVYDLTAIIDVLKTNTAFDKVHFAGISQGTASFFVMTPECPAYNKKTFNDACFGTTCPYENS